MSYNGSGTFLINTAGQPVVSGTVISSTAFNALTADLATGLSTAITKDGQTTVTANIPMGTYKFTGLGAGTAATDSANLSQVQSTVTKLLASVSGADTITAVGSPTLGAYAAGQMFYFVAASANTGAVTINIDSLGAKSITRDGTTALAAGDIQSGEVCVIVYDGTQFQLVNGASQSASIVTENLTVNKATVLNESGGDNDTRIEGDTDANLFFADASTDRIGIGTSSPAYKLDVSTTTGDTQAAIYDRATGSSAARLDFRTSGTGASQWFIQTGNTTGGLNGALRFYNQGTASEVARFDSSGNLGLGVTPSAWSGVGGVFELKGNAYIGSTTNSISLASNAYFNGSNWIYKSTAAANLYSIDTGQHKWLNAASGTAGNAITFTQAMTLDASGNLGVGTTSIAAVTGFSSSRVVEQIGGTNGYGQLRLGNDAGTMLDHDNSGATTTTLRNLYGASSTSALMQIQSGYITFGTGTSYTERARIDSSGNLLVGTTTNGGVLTINGSSDGASRIRLYNQTTELGALGSYLGYIGVGGANDLLLYGSANMFVGSNGYVAFTAGGSTERARITSGGDLLVGKTTQDAAISGCELRAAGLGVFTATDNNPLVVNRRASDGTLVLFRQDNADEGSISVSGNTVSYNAFAGSHWSQLQDGSKPDILRGTVMESINELCVWPGEQNERLPKAKISDTAGSKKVYGVFMAWDNDWTETNDMYVTSVGAFICRVNGSVTVQEGDLLESNGDGTARVQADDIIRSSTIGKVTSTVKTHEYDDGSYCVPTVLYCG